MDDKNIKNFINSSSLGVYTKYLRVENGQKYLVKSGRGYDKKNTSILEPVTERICYELAKAMNIGCAKYTIENSKDGLLSVSKWFYDESEEIFYSANKLVSIFKFNRYDLYNELINHAPNIKQDLDNMIVFDYIINNTDRHLKNFGVLMKGDKLRLAPMYDNGLALGSHLDDEYIKDEDIEDLLLDADYAKCFDTSNRKQLDIVKNHTLNIEFDYKAIIKKYEQYFTEKRMDFIIRLLEERIKVVRECLCQSLN